MPGQMKIKAVPYDDIVAYGFSPEPHTVSLKEEKDPNIWYALFADEKEKAVSVCCVSDRHGGKYFSQTFTQQNERNKGYCTILISSLAKKYYDHKCIAHCLKSSVHCYEKAGFVFVKLRKFKYGDQYYMVKNPTNKD